MSMEPEPIVTAQDRDYLLTRIQTLHNKYPAGITRSALINSTTGFDAAKLTSATTQLASGNLIVISERTIQTSRRTEHVTVYSPTDHGTLMKDVVHNFPSVCPTCQQDTHGVKIIVTQQVTQQVPQQAQPVTQQQVPPQQQQAEQQLKDFF